MHQVYRCKSGSQIWSYVEILKYTAWKTMRLTLAGFYDKEHVIDQSWLVPGSKLEMLRLKYI